MSTLRTQITDRSGKTWTLETRIEEWPGTGFSSVISSPDGQSGFRQTYSTWETATVGHHGAALAKIHQMIERAEAGVGHDVT